MTSTRSGVVRLPFAELLSMPASTLLRALMPKGVRLVRCETKARLYAWTVCSVVFDVPSFLESELRALDSRLNNPWTIRGGFTVPQMLDRLAQVGLEVELEVKCG